MIPLIGEKVDIHMQQLEMEFGSEIMSLVEEKRITWFLNIDILSNQQYKT